LGDTVLLGYFAMSGLAHSRITRVPISWLYADTAGSVSSGEQAVPACQLHGFFND
jgi:hypothetical protein